ncbi:hypothetical protein Dimus_002639 [Dionaea muscipula]
MSLVSRRRINKRSMSPVTIRFSSCSAPYKREQQRGFSQGILCKNCRRPGHFVREYPNVAVCHNCGLRGICTVKMEVGGSFEALATLQQMEVGQMCCFD